MAAALGYGDADDLMADISQAARTVAWITDAVLHRMHLRSTRRRWRRKVRELGHRIRIVDETLQLDDDAPVATDPVKLIWSTSGWPESAAPASSPVPGTRFRAPGGRPVGTGRVPPRSAV